MATAELGTSTNTGLTRLTKPRYLTQKDQEIMKRLDYDIVPNVEKTVIMHRYKIKNFEEYPKNVPVPTLAEFRLLAFLYEDYNDHKGKSTTERGISRKSLKTHVVMLDKMRRKGWLLFRGERDAVVYATQRGHDIYELAYFVSEKKMEMRRQARMNVKPKDMTRTYYNALPKSVRLLIDEKDLEPYEVYKTYRQVGREYTELKYGESYRRDE